MSGKASFAETFGSYLAGGELRIARCTACSQALGYAERRCRCRAVAPLEWVAAQGGARLHSFAVYYRRYSAEFEPPYAVAVVELDEGPMLISTVRTPAQALVTDMRLVAAFDKDGRLVFDPWP